MLLEFLKKHHLNEVYLFIYLFFFFFAVSWFFGVFIIFKAALLQPKNNFQDILKELHS